MNLDKDVRVREQELSNIILPKIKSEKAVTLTALVITIIVLIILAAISVLGVFGENGIFKSAITAKVDTEVAAYTEELKAIEVQTRTQEMKTSSEFVYLNAFETNVRNNSMFKEAREVEQKNENTILRIVTKEGYIFYVSDDETEGIISGGIIGEVEEPEDLIEGKNVVFSYDDSKWTQGPKDVTIILQNIETEHQLQYSVDGKKWINCDSGVVVSMKTIGNVYARLHNGVIGGGVAKATIEKIDTLKPNAFVPEIYTTADSITVKANTTDAAATSKSGCSGIASYEYSKNGKENWVVGTSEYTFTEGITAGETYVVVVRVTDNAGNVYETTPIEKATVPLPALSDGSDGKPANLSIMCDPSTYTNKNVKVTISTTENLSEYGFRLEYSLDGTNYTEYTKPFELEKNGKVWVVVSNGNGKYGKAFEKTINWIDKLSPDKVEVEVTGKTSNSITVKVDAQDAVATSEYACSGIKNYQYSIDGGVTYQNGGTSSTYTFKDLMSNTKYEIKVKVEDKAGNPAETDIISGENTTTDKVPDLDPGTGDVTNPKVTFTRRPDDKFVKSLVIIPTINIDTTGYTLKYQKDREGWKNFESGMEIPFDKNGRLVIMATDGKNDGSAATYLVSNIDNLVPEMTKLECVELPEDDEREGISKIIVGAEDKETQDYTTSGLKEFKYCYSLYGKNEYSNWESITIDQSEIIKTKEMQFEITDLKPKAQYTVKVKALDNLNNESSERNIEVTASGAKIPTLKDEDTPEGKANIRFIVNPEGWTRETVNVKAELSEEIKDTGYVLKFTRDENQNIWKDYPTDGVDFEDNGSLYVRLEDPNDSTQFGKTLEKKISNIDKTAPDENFTFKTLGESATKITVSAKTVDNQSGLATIKFKYAIESTTSARDEDLNWSEYTEEIQVNTSGSASYTIKNLTENTTYRIKAMATDKVGNFIESSNHISKSTTETGGGQGGIIDNPDDKITYRYTPESGKWTRTGNTNAEKVKVELIFSSVDPTKYNVEYTKDDGENWITCDLSINNNAEFYVENNGLLRARLINKDDGTKGEDYWGEVWWIDNEKPAPFTVVAESGIRSITIKGHSSGDYGSDGYRASGIVKYIATYYETSKDSILNENEKWANSKELIPTAEEIQNNKDLAITFKDIVTEDSDGNPIEYTVLMKAVDAAGNESDARSSTCTAQDIPAIAEGDITYTFSNSKDGVQYWTNETPITLTLILNDTLKNYINNMGCKLIYKIEENTDYKEYTGNPISINKATYIELALKYDGMIGKKFTLSEEAKIDVNPPDKYILDESKDVISTSASLKFKLPLEKLVDNGAVIEFDGEERTILSGINPEKFTFKLENFVTGEEIELAETNAPEYTFNGLSKTTEYQVTITYYDNAGNSQTIEAIKRTDSTLVTKSGMISFTMRPDPGPDSNNPIYCKDYVIVGIDYNPSYEEYEKITNYEIWYAIRNSSGTTVQDFQKYVKENTETEKKTIIQVKENNLTIAVQLRDSAGTGSSSVSCTVSHLDTQAPTVSLSSTSATVYEGENAQFTATISDAGVSGVAGYYVTSNPDIDLSDGNLTGIDNWNTAKAGINTINFEASSLHEGLNTYYLWVWDNALNVCDKKILTITVKVKYLADYVSVGDYVDIGVSYTSQLNNVGVGWRVLRVTGSGANGVITLFTTGCPLSFYHYNDTTTSLSLLNNMYGTLTKTSGEVAGFRKSGFSGGNFNLKSIFDNVSGFSVSKGIHAMTRTEIEYLYNSITGMTLSKSSPYSSDDTFETLMGGRNKFVWAATRYDAQQLWRFYGTNYQQSWYEEEIGVKVVISLSPGAKYVSGTGKTSTNQMKYKY